MKVHELKTIEPFFSDVAREQKTFEIRKNDRDFKEEDLLLLREYDPVKKEYSGREILCEVAYILRDYDFEGIAPGFCAMSIVILKSEL